MARGWHIGIIGGSPLAEGIALDDAQEIAVASPFGEPSGPVFTGTLNGIRVTYLARHGAGHRLPASSVNYRANIDVLKRCGVSDVLAIGAVRSLNGALVIGDLVVVEQFVDFTAGRERSFFGPGVVAQLDLSNPVCPRLSGLAAASARAAGASVHEQACYVTIEGPQFATLAEARLYRSWGGDVVGMTGMPEARLAREAELPYALLAIVVDPAAGAGSGRSDAELVSAVIGQTAAGLPARRDPSPIDAALDGAIVTASGSRDSQLVARLDAVAGRVLR